MPYFSGFWHKHYKEFPNCCMTEPLQNYYGSSKYVRYIDVDWMRSKGLKWITLEKNGHIDAWTDSQGMIYITKELQLNEEGKALEKKTGKKIKIDPVYSPRPAADMHSYWLEVIEQQKDHCSLCPGHGGSIEDDDNTINNAIGGTEPAINASSWKALAGGGIPGHGGYATYPPITDYADIIYVDHIIDTISYGGPGGSDQNIQTGPIGPTTPLPTPPARNGSPAKGVHTSPGSNKPGAARPNPITDTQKITNTHPVGVKTVRIDNLRVKPTLPITIQASQSGQQQKKPTFVNNSNKTFWVKPEDDYDKDGNVVDQNDPNKGKKVVIWSSGAYPVPPGGSVTYEIDGYTQQGSGKVYKVNDYNNKGLVVGRNGVVSGIGLNIGGGLQNSRKPGFEQLFDRANEK